MEFKRGYEKNREKIIKGQKIARFWDTFYENNAKKGLFLRVLPSES